MSARGLVAEIHEGGRHVGDCYLIGRGVPAIHVPSGNLPVYHVVDHLDGALVSCRDGTKRKLAAFPATWPGPGRRSERSVYVKHERLLWNAPIPCMDLIEGTEEAAA